MRAAKVCSVPDCPEIQPCSQHRKQAWAGSTRTSRLRKRSGSRQQKLRRFVLRRDHFTCHVCGQQFPPEQLVNDHVIPLSQGGADTVTNMAPCCLPCHNRKTQREAREGRTR